MHSLFTSNLAGGANNLGAKNDLRNKIRVKGVNDLSLNDTGADSRVLSLGYATTKHQGQRNIPMHSQDYCDEEQQKLDSNQKNRH